MANALAAVVDTEVPDFLEAPVRPAPRRPAAQAPETVLAPPPPRPDEDTEFAAALLGVLRDQRWDASGTVASRLRARGVDANVCHFVEDDLREATEALSDIEAFFQESLEALGRAAPGVLMAHASDAAILERVDHLHLVLSGLRRRLVQVAAGVRRR